MVALACGFSCVAEERPTPAKPRAVKSAEDKAASCGEILKKPKSARQSFLEDGAEFFRRQNSGPSISEVVGELKIVAKVDDAVVVHQKTGIKIVRQTQLSESTFASVSLRGRQVESLLREGEYFVIVTKSADGKQRWFNLVHESMERADVTLPYGRAAELKSYALPDNQGWAHYVSHKLLFLYETNLLNPTERKTRLSARHFEATVQSVEFDDTFGGLPVARVRFKGTINDPSFVMDYEASTRNYDMFVDYSAAGAESVGKALPEFEIILTSMLRSRFRVFTETLGDTKLAYIFINSVRSRSMASVAVISFSRRTGWKKNRERILPLRIDLATLSASPREYAFNPYAFLAEPSPGSLKSEKFQLLMPNVSSLKSEDYPLMLRETQVLYHDAKRVKLMLQADHRQGRDSLHSPTLGWRTIFFRSSGSFSLNSTLPFRDVTDRFPIEAEYSPGTLRTHPFLFAKVDGMDPNGWLVINTDNADTLWMPNIERIQILSVERQRRILFWSKKSDGDQEMLSLAVYDAEKNCFAEAEILNLHRATAPNLRSNIGGLRIAPDDLAKVFEGKQGPTNLLVWADTRYTAEMGQFNRPSSFGVWAKPADTEIKIMPDFYTLSARFRDPNNGSILQYLIDLRSMAIHRFEGAFTPKVTARASAENDKYFVVAAAHYARSFKSEIESKSTKSPKFLDWTDLFVLRRGGDGQMEQANTLVSGQVHSVEFARENGKTFAIGQAVLANVTRELKSEFRWPLKADETMSSIVNKVPEPIYQDDEGEIFVSRGSSEGPPKVFYHRRGEIMNLEIELKVSPQTSEKSKISQMMGAVFGESAEFVNTQDIQEIRREGDLLFIKTEPSLERTSVTYVYNKRRRNLEIAIPNFKKTIDLGKYRFYIGEASLGQPTIVAVFRAQSHSFVTHFDFGQVTLDTDSPEFIHQRGDYIIFRTRSGSERVFDTRHNHFLGTLPASVKNILAPIEGELGASVNDRIFQTSLARLFERDQAMAELEKSFPLRTSKHGSNSLFLVSESGSGSKSMIDHFIERYITGKLSQKAQYRAVFFQIDGNALNAGTTFRGDIATKFLHLKQAAAQVLAQGYRMVIILKHADRMLSESGDERSDREGDIFSNLAEQIEIGNFDILATASPGGLDQLRRRKASFATRFNRVLRMEPLTKVQSINAVNGFLSEEFGDRPVMSPRQVEKVVARVSRLNGQRALPGSAFAVVKRLVPDEDSPKVVDENLDQALAQELGVPSMLLDKENVRENSSRMREYLNSRVKGVPDLIEQVIHDLFAFALENNRSDWPISRILALGPTGTGKSELAKAIVQFLFANDKPLLKISGEDWKDPGQSMKLKALILIHVGQFPFNVIQLDEWDKMHPENQDVMLSLGDGQIVGPKGEKISSALSLIYATTNLGAQEVKKSVASLETGFRNKSKDEIETEASNSTKDIYQKAMHDNMKPEVINRFDRYFYFPFLRREIARIVAEDYLNGLEGSGIESIRARYALKNVEVHFEESALDYVADHFIDLSLGARRLTINIENAIVRDFLTALEPRGPLPQGLPLKITHDGQLFRLDVLH